MTALIDMYKKHMEAVRNLYPSHTSPIKSAKMKKGSHAMKNFPINKDFQK